MGTVNIHPVSVWFEAFTPKPVPMRILLLLPYLRNQATHLFTVISLRTGSYFSFTFSVYSFSNSFNAASYPGRSMNFEGSYGSPGRCFL